MAVVGHLLFICERQDMASTSGSQDRRKGPTEKRGAHGGSGKSHGGGGKGGGGKDGGKK